MLVTKNLVIFALGVVAVSPTKLSLENITDDFKAQLLKLHGLCSTETGATEEDIETLRKGIFTEDPKIKCYIKCNFLGIELWTDNSEINPAPFANIVPAEMSKEVFTAYDDCNKKLGNINDLCEKSYMLIKCIHETALDSFFVV
ncbi:general odorant-binding protein 83a-like [Anthonomus grandis grandis]|uniref:general odorant-binding protein 83a-like n=1 Tax=Anthonomus grandis grandis TaxID=2921223 RepID=UPI0021664545|nr:general odorant-binding protein 83a-like [Anthonomus grandis grandis]